jgi:hypothetical protein
VPISPFPIKRSVNRNKGDDVRRLFASFCLLGCLTATPAFAVMEDYPSIKLQGLDKSVGRTVTFEAAVGSTIQYGPLFIKIHACRKAPPIEAPEAAAFLQVWEVPPGQEKSEWVFSGWMFASSPALSAMDHPVYDVWVLDCTGREEPNEEAAEASTDAQADQTDLSPADTAQEQPEPADANQPTENIDINADPGVTAYDYMRQDAPETGAPTQDSPAEVEEIPPEY